MVYIKPMKNLKNELSLNMKEIDAIEEQINTAFFLGDCWGQIEGEIYFSVS